MDATYTRPRNDVVSEHCNYAFIQDRCPVTNKLYHRIVWKPVPSRRAPVICASPFCSTLLFHDRKQDPFTGKDICLPCYEYYHVFIEDQKEGPLKKCEKRRKIRSYTEDWIRNVSLRTITPQVTRETLNLK